MQPQSPVCQNLGRRPALSHPNLPARIHMLVTYVETSFRIADPHQASESHRPAFIHRPHPRALLPVMKTSLGGTVAVRGVRRHYKHAIVEAHTRLRGIGARFFRCWKRSAE